MRVEASENTPRHLLTIDSGIADIAGGELALDAPMPVTFTTGEAAP